MNEEYVNAELSTLGLTCVCGNTDLRRNVTLDEYGKVTRIHVYCPKCSETIYLKTNFTEFYHTGVKHD